MAAAASAAKGKSARGRPIRGLELVERERREGGCCKSEFVVKAGGIGS
jgi:hypothetical protein